MPVTKVPMFVRYQIRALYNAGYSPWEIEHLFDVPSAYYVSEYIRDARRRGLITRKDFRTGRPSNKARKLLPPKELVMAGVVRLKNPVTGEVKLIRMEDTRKYRKYGWVYATLTEFRQWHLKQGQSQECDRKHDNGKE
jgi:transposase